VTEDWLIVNNEGTSKYVMMMMTVLTVVNTTIYTGVVFHYQIPVIGKHKPVPKTTYEYPKDQEILDEVKDENRKVSQV